LKPAAAEKNIPFTGISIRQAAAKRGQHFTKTNLTKIRALKVWLNQFNLSDKYK